MHIFGTVGQAPYASHSSGSGGSYTSPAYTPPYTPAYTAPARAPAVAAPEVTPAYRATTATTTTRATADELRSMIMRVQARYTRADMTLLPTSSPSQSLQRSL